MITPQQLTEINKLVKELEDVQRALDLINDKASDETLNVSIGNPIYYYRSYSPDIVRQTYQELGTIPVVVYRDVLKRQRTELTLRLAINGYGQS